MRLPVHRSACARSRMVTPRKGSHGNKHRISYQWKKVPSATSGGLRSCSSAVVDSSTSIVWSSSNASTSSCTLSEPSVSASVTSLLSIRRSLKDQVGCGRPSPVDNASLRGLSRSDRRSSAPSSCRCSDTTCCMWLIPESETAIYVLLKNRSNCYNVCSFAVLCVNTNRE